MNAAGPDPDNHALDELGRIGVTADALAALSARTGDQDLARLANLTRILTGSLDPADTRDWLDDPNRLLGGRTPNEALSGGELGAVERAARDFDEGTWI